MERENVGVEYAIGEEFEYKGKRYATRHYNLPKEYHKPGRLHCDLCAFYDDIRLVKYLYLPEPEYVRACSCPRTFNCMDLRRNDNNDVYFEELALDYRIGEEFNYHGKAYRVVKHDNNGIPCLKCAFADKTQKNVSEMCVVYGERICCLERNREDKQDVYFEELKQLLLF